MKILITGGGGFIGQRITRALVKEGHEVTVTNTGSEPICKGVHKILYHGLEGIDWKCVYGQDALYHLMANNDTLCQDENEMYRANVYGPIKMFIAAAQGGCKKFIYASSTAVYGAEPAPYTEATLVKPLNKYGDSKAKFDEFAMQFAEERKVNVIGLRYCNVYGPGEFRKGRRMSMIGQLLQQMIMGQQPKLFEFGEQKRDWLYVVDAVRANLNALTVLNKDNYGEIYNIGSGTAVTFNEIVGAINECLGTNTSIKYVPCPFAAAYQTHTECDISKIKEDLGFEPLFSLRQGVRQYLKHLGVE